MNQSINSKYNLTYLILFIVLVLSVYKQKQNSKQKKIARSVKWKRELLRNSWIIKKCLRDLNTLISCYIKNI